MITIDTHIVIEVNLTGRGLIISPMLLELKYLKYYSLGMKRKMRIPQTMPAVGSNILRSI